MLHPRSQVTRFERAGILCLIGLMLVGALVKLPDTAFRGLILTTFNFLHYPTFLLLYLLLRRLLKEQRTFFGMGPLLLSIAVASILELSQPLFGRSATLTDFAVSAGGAISGFWVARVVRVFINSQRNRWFYFELILLLVINSIVVLKLFGPVYYAGHVLYTKYRVFPELSAHRLPNTKNYWFTLPQQNNSQTSLYIEGCPYHDAHALEPLQPLPTSLDETQHSEKKAPQSTESPIIDSDSMCLRIVPQAHAWAGIGQILGPNSWAPFESLELEIFAQAAMPISLRIDDVSSGEAYQEHFNREFQLNAGYNHLVVYLSDLKRLPKRDGLDLDQLRKMYLFTSPSAHPPEFFIKRIYLAQ